MDRAEEMVGWWGSIGVLVLIIFWVAKTDWLSHAALCERRVVSPSTGLLNAHDGRAR